MGEGVLMVKNKYPHVSQIYQYQTLIRLLYIILLLFMTWATAERLFGIDRDLLQYKEFYNTLSFNYSGRFEPGFVFFSFILKSLNIPFDIFLYVSAFLALRYKIYLLSRFKNSFLWLLVYLAIIYPTHELTQIRVSIALAFAYYAMYSVMMNEGLLSFRVIFFLLLSVFFHYTCLFFVPFILFYSRLSKPKYLYCLLVVIIPVIFFKLSIASLDVINPDVKNIIFSSELGENAVNPFSFKILTLISVCILGLLSFKIMPIIALPWYYLSLSGISVFYGLIDVPVFAHRILELTVFSSFYWIGFLPVRYKFTAIGIFCVFSMYYLYRIIYIDPLFY